MSKCVKTKTVGIGYCPEFYFKTCMLCVKYVHQDSSCFLACETHQKAGGAYVDSQIWHLLRSTGLTGRTDRSDRSGLYSPSRIRVFVKSPHVILLVKGYVFPGL